MVLIIDKVTRDLIGLQMLLNDDSQSPQIYAQYNTTNGTENLLINVTSEIVSISIAIQNEQVIQGLRFYGTN